MFESGLIAGLAGKISLSEIRYWREAQAVGCLSEASTPNHVIYPPSVSVGNTIFQSRTTDQKKKRNGDIDGVLILVFFYGLLTQELTRTA